MEEGNTKCLNKELFPLSDPPQAKELHSQGKAPFPAKVFPKFPTETTHLQTNLRYKSKFIMTSLL